jgi:acyl dehydratase
MSALRIPASVVGIVVGPREHAVDARWLMAYAAALGESEPEYFDTSRRAGILAHPLFPVCYEWPLALDARAEALPDDVAVRGVHATHRLTLHRPPRVGDRLRTTGTLVALERRTPGAYLVLRMDTVDAAGQPVSTTEYGSLYLGVECETAAPHPGALPEGEREHEAPSPGASGPGEEPTSVEGWRAEIPIAPTLAHVYTECARIWNPIHTDRAVALGAGLPDIILHGTATLAIAISQALRRQPRGAATPVRAVRARFGAMVRMPSRLVVRGQAARPAAAGAVVRFEALAEDGRPAVRDAQLVLAP